MKVQRRLAPGLIARAQGNDPEALNLLRAAADLETSMDKHPVTPAPIMPAREALADLLLELGQPGPALREFEGTLSAEPNRFRSLFGAGRAAELAGDSARARDFYAKLTAQCARADTARRELEHARQYLAPPR